MAKHKVVSTFRDLQDKAKTFPLGRVYEAGDEFPATKRKVPEERIIEIKQKGFIVEVINESKEDIEIVKEVEQSKE